MLYLRRAIHSRKTTARQLEQDSERKFIHKAVSIGAQELLKNPQRDDAYDVKDTVQFSSPEISALHARIGLPETFPLSTLRRCLTDPSTEKDHSSHNEALSVVGSGLLDYYVSEYLCIRWPRLPMKTQLSALWAYTGESALARLAREWGVQSQTVPRPVKKDPYEFDPSPKVYVNPPSTKKARLEQDLESAMEWEIREQAKQGWFERPGQMKRGFLDPKDDSDYQKLFVLFALQRFVRSVVGGVYVHSVFPNSGTADGVGSQIYSIIY